VRSSVISKHKLQILAYLHKLAEDGRLEEQEPSEPGDDSMDALADEHSQSDGTESWEDWDTEPDVHSRGNSVVGTAASQVHERAGYLAESALEWAKKARGEDKMSLVSSQEKVNSFRPRRFAAPECTNTAREARPPAEGIRNHAKSCRNHPNADPQDEVTCSVNTTVQRRDDASTAGVERCLIVLPQCHELLMPGQQYDFPQINLSTVLGRYETPLEYYMVRVSHPHQERDFSTQQLTFIYTAKRRIPYRVTMQ